MRYTLTQLDSDDIVINTSSFQTLDIKNIINEVYYCDIASHEKLIENWITSGAYRSEDLTVYGDEVFEDGFTTEAMYLTLTENLDI